MLDAAVVRYKKLLNAIECIQWRKGRRRIVSNTTAALPERPMHYRGDSSHKGSKSALSEQQTFIPIEYTSRSAVAARGFRHNHPSY